jgi:hypothetical protein
MFSTTRLPGQRHREHAALPHLTGHGNISSMQFNQSLDQGETQTGPFMLSGQTAVHLGKGLEQFVIVFRRNTNTSYASPLSIEQLDKTHELAPAKS